MKLKGPNRVKLHLRLNVPLIYHESKLILAGAHVRFSGEI